jgi:membrane protease YdiL (CAAX protease family)
MTRRTGSVRGTALLLACVLLAGAAATAWAEDPPKPSDVAKPAQGEPAALLPSEVAEKPAALAAILVLQLGACVGGMVVVVRAWLRWDRVRGGLLPPPVHVVPTAPFALGSAVLLLLLSHAAIFAVNEALLRWRGVDRKDLAASLPYLLSVQAGIGLSLTAIVGLRRLRLASPRPPGPGRALAIGARTWCLAVLIVLPIHVVWFYLLRAMDRQPGPQDLVKFAMDRTQPTWIAIALAVYGVAIAPVVEEALYRGVLYPAIRSWLGGTRRAVWVSALVTSALFAAAHMDVTALVPLFVLAMVLALAFERTNSLAGSIFAHALFNLGTMVSLMLARFT